MATIEVSFSALPAHVRTARLVAVAVARRSGVADGLLDEIRLAVGEACSRAVGLHRNAAPQTPVRMTMHDEQDRFTVVVADVAPAQDPPTMLESLDPAVLAAPQENGSDDLPTRCRPASGSLSSPVWSETSTYVPAPTAPGSR
jgi:anti-sigma regulatory factor (Ser/Thr protein kinase)